MHFSSAAVLALCSISVTYAAPFANPENEDLARRATYSVVNADEDCSSSPVAREVDTVFETSTVTAPNADPVPITVTVTATPSSVTSPSTAVASPTSCWETPNVLPTAGSSSFFRRGLRAAGQPAIFAREYSSSLLYAREYPTASASESLYARGWYSAASGTPSIATSTASPTSLVARNFGDSYSSAWVPTSSLVTATPLVARGLYSSAATSSASATSLVARGFSPSYSSGNIPLSPTPLAARDSYASPSGTFSIPSIPTSAAPLAARGPYGWYSSALSTSPIATSSASPAIVARGARSWGSSSASSTFSASATPVAY
ncbi:uncharacterized protein N7518_000898 [Penicillium psychrosexuale]|uniref:uncharacterized protein n=1 Tax=Penicillium psychrosexuale TaxID=1002107 RepID=UPI002545BC04|nr:uncharacterized protein N7518_000898 [Penicillium psychrosexuale]KAJ5804595.1 hypothetical protein N7518_000898 [Penicillium psychrosexuale]